MKTIVLQSFRTTNVPRWITRCMQSVRSWARSEGWNYECLDDDFFNFAPQWVRERCGRNIYALTDVCRLRWLGEQLDAGYERAVWVDADVLVFAPDNLSLNTQAKYAFAHELLLEVEEGGEIEHCSGLNNALMMFDQGQDVLDNYLNACLETLSDLPSGEVPRTALGPELLRSLNSRDSLNMVYGIGLFTPAIMLEIVGKGGPLSSRYAELSPAPLGAANLCHFTRNTVVPAKRPVFDSMYNQAVSRLLDTEGRVMSKST